VMEAETGAAVNAAAVNAAAVVVVAGLVAVVSGAAAEAVVRVAAVFLEGRKFESPTI
jgi:hypothetical protein